MARGRKENLIVPSSEQARINGSKGGKASAKAKREKKQMREEMQEILNLAMKGGDVIEIANLESFESIRGKNVTVQTAMLLSQAQKAIKGDKSSAEFCRDTAGEKPKDSLDVNMDTSPIVINNNVTE